MKKRLDFLYIVVILLLSMKCNYTRKEIELHATCEYCGLPKTKGHGDACCAYHGRHLPIIYGCAMGIAIIIAFLVVIFR